MPSSASFKMGRACKAFVRETLDDAYCTLWLAIARQLPMNVRWDTVVWRIKQIVQRDGKGLMTVSENEEVSWSLQALFGSVGSQQ